MDWYGDNIEQGLGRPHTKGDIEEDLANLGVSSPGAERMDDRAGLFVTRARQAKLVREGAEASVGFGDRPSWVIEASQPGYQSGVDVRCGARHRRSVHARTESVCQESATSYLLQT